MRTTRAVVYYVGLIAWVGCHVDAYEQAKWFGDDMALKADAHHVDMTGLPAKAFVVTHVGAGRGLAERARLGVKFVGGGRRAAREMIENHWLATNDLAGRLGLGAQVREGLYQTFERWDGKGVPAEAKGSEILVPARLVSLADVVEVYHRTGGVEAAVAVARERSGTQFDPALVEVFSSEAPTLFRDIDAVTTWPAVIEAEPALGIVLSDEELESALEAIADFTDLKSPWTHRPLARRGRPRRRSRARCPASRTRMPDLVRRAGLVHDLGRLGVSNAIWDKRGTLTAAELERVRLHPYLTERMLASSGALASVGAIAVQHHERLDGSGYPRGLSGDAIAPAGRILAAADAYHAMTEPRPHRARAHCRARPRPSCARASGARCSTATRSTPCFARRAIRSGAGASGPRA